jgi:hypothetical protein
MTRYFPAKLILRCQERDRIEPVVHVGVFMGLNVLTYFDNQCIRVYYEIITKFAESGKKWRLTFR